MLRRVGAGLLKRSLGADGKYLNFLVFVWGAFTRRADTFQ